MRKVLSEPLVHFLLIGLAEFLKVINLFTDLKEERDVATYYSWVIDPVVKIVTEFEESLKKYPPIKLGTPDPYVPPK